MNKCFLIELIKKSDKNYFLHFCKYNISIWIAKKDIAIWDYEKKTFGKFYNIGAFLYLKKMIPSHQPQKIAPKFNQEPIEELKI